MSLGDITAIVLCTALFAGSRWFMYKAEQHLRDARGHLAQSRAILGLVAKTPTDVEDVWRRVISRDAARGRGVS